MLSLYLFVLNEGSDILLDGEIQKFHGIADSEKKGIAIIYQELALVPELSIYENIYFGHEIRKGQKIDWNETIVRAREMLEKVRLDVDASMKVKELGVGNQQLVEIAKALSKDVQLLILDEPTASLNEDDSENLLSLIRELKSQGVTCIMISHKLKEIIEIADTITVLRDGSTICSLDAREHQITEAEIIKHMVGREITNIYPKREHQQIGEVVFEVKNWSASDHGKEILKNISLNVRKGEIVGLQGLMGAGRTEFALSIFGNSANYKITGGEIYLNGEKCVFRTPKDAIEKGLAYVSEDRKGNGLILIQDIRYNISLANLKELTESFRINDNAEIVVTNDYKEKLNIKASSVEKKVMDLSGGNQQKVSIAKWLFAKPRVLILDEPTRGIDVGAKYEIYTLMNQLVEQGMSIIMISSELPEVLGMSDRLYIMSEGKICGELSAENADAEKVMELAVKA